jgi:3-deoxy-manno-octulosonate cytidylyltransferase (CMP-KDO synthetase)
VKAIAIIPARLGSVRLPRKPLRLIAGKPLIQHVVENVKKARLLDDVIVATDSAEIVAMVEHFGCEAILTSPAHSSGTERIAEAARKFKKYDIFVNVQGDEPLMSAVNIDRLVRDFAKERAAEIASLFVVKNAKEEFADPNVVKVTVDKSGYALYFSRSPIPYDRSGKGGDFLKHLGVYAYKRKFLLALPKLKASWIENQEKLEQLKWLDNGYRIRMISCRTDSIGVDTEDDITAVERFLEKKVRTFA